MNSKYQKRLTAIGVGVIYLTVLNTFMLCVLARLVWFIMGQLP